MPTARLAAARPYVQIARLDQWTKNVLMLLGVLLAYFFRPESFSWSALPRLLLAVVVTGIVASSNYVLNEILDASTDRHHPTKRNRPLASGQAVAGIAVVEWLFLGAVGLASALAVGRLFALSALSLWIMGLVYNVPPVRTKEVPYLDVLTESINNPIRLLLGWFALIGTQIPPMSLLLCYWMGGAFLMATKRFAELRTIKDKQTAGRYRRSFRLYSEESLIISMLFYATASALLGGIFIARFRVELVLVVPVVSTFFAYYMHLAFREDSPVQHPERLIRERGFCLLGAASLVLLVGLMFTHIPVLYELFEVEPAGMSSLWTLGAGPE